MTNYIQLVDREFQKKDRIIIAQKDGITVIFSLELSIKTDVYEHVVPEIEYQSANVESGVSVTPNDEWINEFSEIVLKELESNSQYAYMADNFLTENLDEEPDFENDDY